MSDLPLPPDFSGAILVVRRDNIGDLVCTTPLIAGLRAAFPRARIEALVNSYNAPVLAGNPDLDAVHVYTKLKHRGPEQSAVGAVLARLRLVRALRRRRFAVALLARSGFDRHGLGFVRLLGIPTIVGFAPAQGEAPPALSAALPPPDPLIHEVEAVAQLAAALGVRQACGPLRLFADPARVAAFAAGTRRVLIAVHISAREASRRLPEDKWIALIRGLLAARSDVSVALFWAPGAEDDAMHPGDDGKAQRVLAGLDGLPVKPCPTAELAELMVGIAACDLFIGADGGALHVAVGLGRPCVALFENSEFKLRHWYPWQVPHRTVVAATFAIGDIAPQAIIDAALPLLPPKEPIP